MSWQSTKRRAELNSENAGRAKRAIPPERAKRAPLPWRAKRVHLSWGPVVQSALRARGPESSKDLTKKAASKRRKSSTDLVVTTA